MRTLIALTIIAVGVAAAMEPADARKGARKAAGQVYGYRAKAAAQRTQSNPRDDAADCVRANDSDPAKQFGNLPCWARNALSGRGVSAR